jgi:hypothetical protein
VSSVAFPHLTDRESVREEADKQWGGLNDAAAYLSHWRASQDPNVAAAARRKVNPDETAKVQDDLSLAQAKVDSEFGKGTYTVLDAVVRGDDHLSVVVEDATGRTSKRTIGWTDKWRPVPSTADAEEERLNAQASAHKAQLAAEMRAEVARQVEKATAKIQDEYNEKLSKLLEEVEKRRADAVAKVSDSDSSDGGEERVEGYPATHDELDALASQHGLDWPKGTKTVAQKQAALQDAGIEPAEED